MHDDTPRPRRRQHPILARYPVAAEVLAVVRQSFPEARLTRIAPMLPEDRDRWNKLRHEKGLGPLPEPTRRLRKW